MDNAIKGTIGRYMGDPERCMPSDRKALEAKGYIAIERPKPVEPHINLRSAFAPKCLRCGNAIGLLGCGYCEFEAPLSAQASQQYPGGLSAQGSHSPSYPGQPRSSAIREGLREAFKPILAAHDTMAPPMKTEPAFLCQTCQDSSRVICPTCEPGAFRREVEFMRRPEVKAAAIENRDALWKLDAFGNPEAKPLDHKAMAERARMIWHAQPVTREEVAAQYPDPVKFKARTPEERDQQLKQAAAIIEKGMTEASVARAADHALAAVDERPDKNLEETKDFPNDYTHNRARDVIKGILDKSIKPGGIREIKRALTDREKDDDKGPKPFPSKALRLNAASWLTGR